MLASAVALALSHSRADVGGVLWQAEAARTEHALLGR